MFDHILVTTDGSDLGNLALPVAADLARKYDSSLTLLYVVPQLLMLLEGAAYTYDYPMERERSLAEGKRILEDARRRLDYPRTQVVELEEYELKTEQAILNEVERSGAKLVVMSTHGRSGLAHLFLGSVAEAVLRKIRVPLLLIQFPDRVMRARTELPAEKPALPETQASADAQTAVSGTKEAAR